MRRGKLIVIIAMVFSLSMLSGCWDSIEINNLAFVMGIAVDRSDDEKDLIVTTQIAKPDELNSSGVGEEGGGKKKAYVNLTGQGPGVMMSLYEIASDLNRRIYTGHNQVIVISSDVAKDGLASILDFFIRGSDDRFTVPLFISEGEAKDTFNVNSDMERLPAAQLKRHVNIHEGEFTISETKLINFLNDILSNTTAPTIPLIKTVEADDGNGTKNEIAGIAVFDGDKMCTTLDTAQSVAIMLIKNEHTKGYFQIEALDSFVTLRVKEGSSKVSSIFEDGKFKMLVDITLDCIIVDTGVKADFLSEDVRNEFGQTASEYMAALIESTIDYTKEYSADVFGFGENIYRCHPKESAQLLENWGEEYPGLEIDLCVKVEVLSTGAVMCPFGAHSKSDGNAGG